MRTISVTGRCPFLRIGCPRPSHPAVIMRVFGLSAVVQFLLRRFLGCVGLIAAQRQTSACHMSRSDQAEPIGAVLACFTSRIEKPFASCNLELTRAELRRQCCALSGAHLLHDSIQNCRFDNIGSQRIVVNPSSTGQLLHEHGLVDVDWTREACTILVISSLKA